VTKEMEEWNQRIEKQERIESEKSRIKDLLMPRNLSMERSIAEKISIERSNNQFFTLYDDSQFENKTLPSMINDQDPFKGAFK
jgi:hypothetical protein